MQITQVQLQDSNMWKVIVGAAVATGIGYICLVIFIVGLSTYQKYFQKQDHE